MGCRIVLELGAIAQSSGNFAVAMTAREKLRFLHDIRIDHGMYRNMIGTVNAETSVCSMESDRVSIHEGIRSTVGFSSLNRMVFGAIEEWMREALHDQVAIAMEAGDELEAASWNHVLANILHDQGRLDDALVMKEKTLEFYRRVLPESHPDIGEGLCLDTIGCLVVTRSIFDLQVEPWAILATLTLTSGGTKMRWQ